MGNPRVNRLLAALAELVANLLKLPTAAQGSKIDSTIRLSAQSDVTTNRGNMAQADVRGSQESAEPYSRSRVDAVLRTIPSHGWQAGWIGRRDRALLVLSQIAGLSYRQIAELKAGDISISEGVATIRQIGSSTTVKHSDDDLICAPCALARWLHALELTVVYPDNCVVASVIARAMPLTANSPHLCQGETGISESTARMSLMPTIDQWGVPVVTAVLAGPTRPREIPNAIPVQRVGVILPDAAAVEFRAGGLESIANELMNNAISAAS